MKLFALVFLALQLTSGQPWALAVGRCLGGMLIYLVVIGLIRGVAKYRDLESKPVVKTEPTYVIDNEIPAVFSSNHKQG